jgi:CRISPR system Cascade subunit CasD
VTQPTEAPRSVLMVLDGPLQAYGTHARFERRDTGMYPTVSAITGMIACALGHSRETELGPLTQLEIAVRIDQQGSVMSDFQTVGIEGWRSASGTVKRGEAKLCTRYYLQDATFVVAVGHPDPAFLQRIDDALAAPVWPVFLGRKSCPPATPIRAGVSALDPIEALAKVPYKGYLSRPPATLPVVVTDPTGAGDVVQDIPLDFDVRRYGPRATARMTVSVHQPPPAVSPAVAFLDDEDNLYGI